MVPQKKPDFVWIQSLFFFLFNKMIPFFLKNHIHVYKKNTDGYKTKREQWLSVS